MLVYLEYDFVNADPRIETAPWGILFPQTDDHLESVDWSFDINSIFKFTVWAFNLPRFLKLQIVYLQNNLAFVNYQLWD